MVVLIFLIACFGLYRLFKRIRNKKARPLWGIKDENHLKDALSKIYSSTSLEDLSKSFKESVTSYPKYHDLLNTAKEEVDQKITQNTIPVTFEEKESKVRKMWLIALCAQYFIGWLSLLVAILLVPRFEANLNGATLVGSIIVITIIPGFWSWLFYHCSYNKKGTRLLSFVVFTTPLVLLKLLVGGIDFSLWYVEIFNLVVIGFFWYCSLCLRQINNEAKARQQLAGLKIIM